MLRHKFSCVACTDTWALSIYFTNNSSQCSQCAHSGFFSRTSCPHDSKRVMGLELLCSRNTETQKMPVSGPLEKQAPSWETSASGRRAFVSYWVSAQVSGWNQMIGWGGRLFCSLASEHRVAGRVQVPVGPRRVCTQGSFSWHLVGMGRLPLLLSSWEFSLQIFSFKFYTDILGLKVTLCKYCLKTFVRVFCIFNLKIEFCT